LAKDLVEEMFLDAPESHRPVHADECKQHELIFFGGRVPSIIAVRAAKQRITALESGIPDMKVRHRRP
jgi:hypothetical protein